MAWQFTVEVVGWGAGTLAPSESRGHVFLSTGELYGGYFGSWCGKGGHGAPGESPLGGGGGGGREGGMEEEGRVGGGRGRQEEDCSLVSIITVNVVKATFLGSFAGIWHAVCKG